MGEKSQIHYQLIIPERFNFKKPSEWPTWICRFERFRMASGLEEKSAVSQVNMLIYCLGDEGEDLLSSFNLSDAELKDYDAVRSKFEAYLGFKKNIVYERAKFLKRRQDKGEPVDVFINDLHKLAERCNFGHLKEELIRDLIVIGVQDQKLSENLQMDEKLDLDKAILKARQAESLQMRQNVTRGTRKVEELNKKSTSGSNNQTMSDPPTAKKEVKEPKKESCLKCGSFNYHPTAVSNLPNKSRFFQYGLTGHLGRLREICEKKTPKRKSYLGEVTVRDQERWSPPMIFGGKEVWFKLESEADDVSMIDKKVNNRLGVHLPNAHPGGSSSLKVEKVNKVPLKYKHKSTGDLHLLDEPLPLLRRKAIQESWSPF